MRQLGQALIQYDWYPYKSGKFGPKDSQREDDLKRHREKTAICKPRRETQNRSFSQSSQEKPTLMTLWFQSYSLQNCETIIFLLLKSPWFLVLCCGSPSKVIQTPIQSTYQDISKIHVFILTILCSELFKDSPSLTRLNPCLLVRHFTICPQPTFHVYGL